MMIDVLAIGNWERLRRSQKNIQMGVCRMMVSVPPDSKFGIDLKQKRRELPLGCLPDSEAFASPFT